MITSVHFDNFKSLNNYSVSLKKFNVLIGPNNTGKSTILDAFRVLNGAYRYSSKLNPKTLILPNEEMGYGYEVPESSIPIVIEHVHTDYNDLPTTISFRCTGDKYLDVRFFKDRQPYLLLRAPGRLPSTSSAFRREFPLGLSIIPTLGPLEHEEGLNTPEYVNRYKASHRAPGLLRNIWYHDPSNFDKFKRLLEESWPGMSVELPSRASTLSDKLVMFCIERGITRELFWVGSGFQIWIQLLTHIVKSEGMELMVVDEPEIYLHPDLQRKVTDILRSLSSRVVLASHSVEIINEVDPDDVLIVDKNQRAARRLTDLEGMQGAVNLLGSTQNIHLARLARGKNILFVEGKDKAILNRIAITLGRSDLFSTGGITVIPIEGFSNWERASDTKWAFNKILKEDIAISAIYDRDFKCQEEVDDFLKKVRQEVPNTYVFNRHEIENYLLMPAVIKKSVCLRLGIAQRDLKINIEDLLARGTDVLKNEVVSQLSSEALRYKRSSGIAPAQIMKDSMQLVDNAWPSLDDRLKIVPGKELLTYLNVELQKTLRISLTPSLLLHCMEKQDVDPFLDKIFEDISKQLS